MKNVKNLCFHTTSLEYLQMLKFIFDEIHFNVSILLNLVTNIYNCWITFTTLLKSGTHLHANMLTFYYAE